MHAVLSRRYGDKETRGCLYVFEGDLSLLDVKTIELPYKGNQTNISCIPPGRYKCKKKISPTKGECISVLDVPGRSNILIHSGNYASGLVVDTQGCILPGLFFTDINKDGGIDVAESRRALNMLMFVLSNEFDLLVI
jgi:hypothetical protein